jgi:hypothetical protein
MQRSILALAVAVGLACALPIRAELSRSSELIRKWMESPRATRGQCILALSVLLDGRKAGGEPFPLVDRFRREGILEEPEMADLDLPASRGYASLLFMRAIGEKGGLFSRLLHSSQHAAYRHMSYLGLVPYGGSGVTLSGPELASLVSLCRQMFRPTSPRMGVKP